MNSLDNPYSGIINIMRQEGIKNNAPGLMVGRVVNAVPIVIQVGDIELDKDNLYVADYLMPGYQRNLKASFNLSLDIKGDTSKATLSSVTVRDKEGNELGTHNHDNHSHSYSSSTSKKVDIDSMAQFSDSGLKKGDTVAIQQLQGTNRFIVFCKLL